MGATCHSKRKLWSVTHNTLEGSAPNEPRHLQLWLGCNLVLQDTLAWAQRALYQRSTTGYAQLNATCTMRVKNKRASSHLNSADPRGMVLTAISLSCISLLVRVPVLSLKTYSTLPRSSLVGSCTLPNADSVVHALTAASSHCQWAVRCSACRPGPQAWTRCWHNGMQLTV